MKWQPANKNKDGRNAKKNDAGQNAEETCVGQMPKNMRGPNAEKRWVGQCRKNKSQGGGAKRRPLWFYCFFCIGQPIFFLHLARAYFFGIWPTHIFSAFCPALFFLHFAQHCFFGGPPIHILSASLYFLFFGGGVSQVFGVQSTGKPLKYAAQKISMGHSPKNKHGP